MQPESAGVSRAFSAPVSRAAANAYNVDRSCEAYCDLHLPVLATLAVTLSCRLSIGAFLLNRCNSFLLFSKFRVDSIQPRHFGVLLLNRRLHFRKLSWRLTMLIWIILSSKDYLKTCAVLVKWFRMWPHHFSSSNFKVSCKLDLTSRAPYSETSDTYQSSKASALTSSRSTRDLSGAKRSNFCPLSESQQVSCLIEWGQLLSEKCPPSSPCWQSMAVDDIVVCSSLTRL